MYESKTQRPLARRIFARRLGVHTLIAFGLIAVSIAMGIAGYMCFEHLSPLDAFLNAAMLLGGMGPVNAPVTDAGKLFAGVVRAVRGPGIHRHRGAAVHAAAASADASLSLGRQVIRALVPALAAASCPLSWHDRRQRSP